MELVVKENNSLTNRNLIALNHQGKQLLWNVSATDKGYVNREFDLFLHINQYWRTLQDDKIQKIFDVYQEINDAFNTGHHRDVLTKILYTKVAILLDLHDFESVKHWVVFKSSINFPDETAIKSTYVESPDKPSTRGQTYIREDYVKLIAMTVILRTMVPIWANYILIIKPDVKNMYKELYAFKLIYKSKLMLSEAMQKLKTYVEHSTLIGKTKHAPILDGMSSEDFPVWMLSLVVTRKLCICDVRGTDSTAIVIIHIYNVIESKIKGIDNNFNGAGAKINSKPFDTPTQENDTAVLEGYKFRQEIQPGDIIALRHSVKDPYLVAQTLQPGIDKALVTSALKTSAVLLQHKVQDAQILLLQYCIKPMLSVRAIHYLPKPTIVSLLAVCQAVLLHRGHKELAGLITAKPGVVDKDLMIASASDSKGRISKEIQDELNYLFPYTRKPNTKRAAVKMTNLASESIDTIIALMTKVNWVLTLPEAQVQQLTGYSNQRAYVIPSNIRSLLAVFVIQIAKKSY